MTVKQILDMPIGQKFGGTDVAIKTCKKTWQVGDVWMQQVVISDETGDALVDVKIGEYIPLQRGSVLHITVGIIQPGVVEKGDNSIKKIYIDQFMLPISGSEPDIEFGEVDKIVRSKIKCWLVSARLQRTDDPIDKKYINSLVDYVME